MSDAPPTRPRRRLVVVADDYGLTEATSRAILAGFEAGGITGTSVLANAPGAVPTLAALAATPRLDAGLHLALVGEDPPISPARSIPTLVDRRGRLAPSWRHLLPRLAAGRIDPGDVARELDAQLAVLVDGGVRPTFLNAHQHLQLWPSIAAVVVEAAHRHGLGYVRTPRSAQSGPTARGIGHLADRLARRLADAGLATSDDFIGLDDAGRLDRATLERRLAGSRFDGRVIEVNAHPGADHDDARARYRWGYAWPQERMALEALPAIAARLDLELVAPSAA